MMTTAKTETIISSRSRNLGYGWSNQPRQYRNSRGDSTLAISVPMPPDVTGGLRSIIAERARAQRGNAGNDWSESLFVGGRLVTAVKNTDGAILADEYDTGHRLITEVLYELSGKRSLIVEFATERAE